MVSFHPASPPLNTALDLFKGTRTGACGRRWPGTASGGTLQAGQPSAQGCARIRQVMLDSLSRWRWQ
eukprot:927962-Rhodomonas_salina.5